MYDYYYADSTWLDEDPSPSTRLTELRGGDAEDRIDDVGFILRDLRLSVPEADLERLAFEWGASFDTLEDVVMFVAKVFARGWVTR